MPLLRAPVLLEEIADSVWTYKGLEEQRLAGQDGVVASLQVGIENLLARERIAQVPATAIAGEEERTAQHADMVKTALESDLVQLQRAVAQREQTISGVRVFVCDWRV